MKTEFREGKKVFVKNKKGIIRLIYENSKKSYILVDFEDGTSSLYNLDGTLISDNNKEQCVLSTIPYDKNGKLDNNYIDADEILDDAIYWLEKNTETYLAKTDYDEELYTNESYYLAFEALKCLIMLRDYYNNGWMPNWKNETKKHVIYCLEDNLYADSAFHISHVMSFKSEKIMFKFLKEQKELLELAKPLL